MARVIRFHEHGGPEVLRIEKAEGSRAVSVAGVIALENWVLKSLPLQSVVLRCGRLYGPDTGVDAPPPALPLHVDAAACVALLAIDRGTPGVFNIAEPNPEIAAEKAIAELGWKADFRLLAWREINMAIKQQHLFKEAPTASGIA